MMIQLISMLMLVPSNFLGKAIISSLTAFSITSSLILSDSNELPSSAKIQNYDSFSSTYDTLNGGSLTTALGINDMRKEAAHFASGKVLEVNVGTGLQSQYYNWEALSSFTGVDSSEGMLIEAKNRIPSLASTSNSKVKVNLQQMDTTQLQYLDDQFDTVIDTFSLCVIENPLSALKEMSRVSKPDGNVILLENSISTNSVFAQIQDITEPLITPFSKGCRWNVRIPELAKQAGLELKSSNSIQLGTISLGIYHKVTR
jgi:ubiquinone/menaquinone biosynthesis C-methylase UbiE